MVEVIYVFSILVHYSVEKTEYDRFTNFLVFSISLKPSRSLLTAADIVVAYFLSTRNRNVSYTIVLPPYYSLAYHCKPIRSYRIQTEAIYKI